MAVITIKVVDRKGDTLTEKSAPEQVSLSQFLTTLSEKYYNLGRIGSRRVFLLS